MNALTLPDIASQSSHHEHRLDWVGMGDSALAVLPTDLRINARTNAGVSLDDGIARRIHMSRLYLELHALEAQPVTPAALQQLLNNFLHSHEGLSQEVCVTLNGDALLSRPALVSPLSGWKSYPFEVLARQYSWGFHVELQVTMAYSSTCTCSIALARLLIQRRFVKDFAGQLDHTQLLAWLGSPQGIVATTHSQCSTATLNVHLQEQSAELLLDTLIDGAEQALDRRKTRPRPALPAAFLLGQPAQRSVHRASRRSSSLFALMTKPLVNAKDKLKVVKRFNIFVDISQR